MTLIIVAIMCVMTSCASSNGKITNADNGDGRATRTLRLKGFSGIDVSKCTVWLKYTQSKKYSVKVTATEQRMETMDIHVTDGILRVKVKPLGRGNYGLDIKDGGDIEMEISCPQLNKLDVSGNAKIELSDICIDNELSIKNSGNMSLNTGMLSGNGDLTIKNDGILKTKMDSTDIKGVSMDNKGILNIETGDIHGDSLTIGNKGRMNITMKDVRFRNTDIKNSGTVNLQADTLYGSTMDVTQGGVMVATLKFKGDTANITNNGSGKMSLDVECGRLQIANNGVTTLEVSGTADDVKISGSGVSNVDNSRLNKF